MKKLFFVLLGAVCWSCSLKQESVNDYIPPLPKNNDYKAVLTAMDHIIENDNRAENYFQRSRINLKAGQLQNSLNDIEVAIEKDNSEPKYYLLRAQIQTEKKSLSFALADAEKAYTLQLRDPELFTLLGELYFKKKNYTKASQNLEKSLNYSPYMANTWFWKGNVALAIADTGLALNYFKTTVKYNPQYVSAYHKLAAIYIGVREFKQAKYYVFQGLKSNPKEADLHFDMAENFRFAGNADSAKLYYIKAAQLDPTIYMSYFRVGSLLFNEKKYSEAVIWLEKAKLHHSEIRGFDELLAYSYDFTGQFENAFKQYVLILNMPSVPVKAIERYWQLKEYFDGLKSKSYYDSLSRIYPNLYLKPKKIDRIEVIKPKEVIIK